MRRVAAAFLCTVVASPSTAAGFARDTGEYLARMDANRDGRVDLVEYSDFLSDGFRNLDKNRDGVVDRLELGRLGGRNRGPITRADHEAKLARTFARQDANRDGYLDRVELAAPPR